MSNDCALKVQHLSFSYGNRKALDNINFELKPASFNGLLGANGAGKTTLFAILTRLLASRQGDVSILGMDLHRYSGKALMNMGVVFQQSTLDLDLSVAQNLHYHAALHGMARKLAAHRISEQLKRFGMLDRQNDKIRSLNQGHRRRVEFARALLHHPRLLLLDEATVGLDVETRHMINQHVRQLCQQHSVTVLWASHLVDDIQNDDHVLLLRQGELIANGSCQQLLAQHHYDSLHQMMLNQGVDSAHE
jgi:ABC-2 type transport system ATP-binding protein